MMTRDGERVIEVLLVAAALALALGVEWIGPADPDGLRSGSEALAISSGSPLEFERLSAQPAPVEARAVADPFQALGAQIGRTVRDLEDRHARNPLRPC